jgi:LysR family transcriptional regulator, hydrogen peroxide-inducible genes activator
MAALTSLKQLQYLVALSDTLNFTRAAENCFVTQSTLSAGLKELEDILGTRLVERDRQSVLMTPVGEEVVRRARSILGAAKDLSDYAAAASRPMSGLLRFGVIPTIAPFMLPRLLPELRGRYPELRLALCEELTVNLLARLHDGRLDFLLIALPYETSHLLVEPLFDDPLWLVGRQDAPEMKGKSVTLSAAISERLILLAEGHCLREHTLYACGPPSRHGGEEIEATSLLTLVQMIESGLGFGLVPQMALRSGLIEGSGLVARPIGPNAPKRTIALAARRSSSRTAEFRALADVARSGYAESASTAA